MSPKKKSGQKDLERSLPKDESHPNDPGESKELEPLDPLSETSDGDDVQDDELTDEEVLAEADDYDYKEGEETEQENGEEESAAVEKKPDPAPEKLTSRQEDYGLIDDICLGPPQKRDQAYKRLLNKYRGQIFSLILKIIHNPNEVEDLVQETFSKAFNSIQNFNKEYAFSTWLYRIATNSSIDYLRKRRLKTFSIDNPINTKDDEFTIEIPDASDEPGKNVIQLQRDALVRAAIANLPPKYKRVIEMRHLQERTYEEISKDLGLPLGTVKAHIFRAREMLYKMLRDKLRNY